MKKDFDIYLQSFFEPLTLLCHKCEREIGKVAVGDFLMLVKHVRSKQMFVGIAPEVDWNVCTRCGAVSTPLIISPEMVGAHHELLTEWVKLHDVPLQEFRQEFPLTPYVNALIAERLTITC